MNRILKPDTWPEDLRFSSGPCAKPPTWKLKELSDAALGRSHRAQVGREKLRKAIEETRKLLEIPVDYKIAIVPASEADLLKCHFGHCLGQKRQRYWSGKVLAKGGRQMFHEKIRKN